MDGTRGLSVDTWRSDLLTDEGRHRPKLMQRSIHTAKGSVRHASSHPQDRSVMSSADADEDGIQGPGNTRVEMGTGEAVTDKGRGQTHQPTLPYLFTVMGNTPYGRRHCVWCVSLGPSAGTEVSNMTDSRWFLRAFCSQCSMATC
jgi:hypothetical protein